MPGNTYPCWAPTAGNNRDNLPSAYNCGDGASPAGDACVKLWDPQDEVDAVSDKGTLQVAAGLVALLIGVGVVLWGASCFKAYRKAVKTEREANQQPAVQMPPAAVAQVVSPAQPAQAVGYGVQPVQAMPVAQAPQAMAVAVAQPMAVAVAQPMAA